METHLKSLQMTTFHNSLLTSQPIISLVSDCSLAEKKTRDFIGYLLPIASKTVDSTIVAEIINDMTDSLWPQNKMSSDQDLLST